MASKVTRLDRSPVESKTPRSKHRPSRTPTGLPGDEPKALHQKRLRQQLGEVVDSLLVPEHKAARRLIRRSQRRNPKMAAGSNMTLYERIMAYRLLKEKGIIGGDSKDEGSGDETKKLERSDSGWGSVDISQYTNKKDSDDNRTPTPPPTITDAAGKRRQKQAHDYDDPRTARDVQVEVDDQASKHESLPQVRTATPKSKGTPTKDRTTSRQSLELHKHPVLPPIHNSSPVKVAEHGEKRLENADMATAAIFAMKERREEKLVDERRKVQLPRRSKSEDELDYKNKGQRDERREPGRESAPVRKESRRFEDTKRDDQMLDELMSDIHKVKKREGNITGKDEIYDNKGDKRQNENEDIPKKGNTRSPIEGSPSPGRQTPPPRHLPRRSDSREHPPEPKRSLSENPDQLRKPPRRKTSMDDEIERLDKMVDRDLNEIIKSLGNKMQNMKDRGDVEENLRKKILDPKFQANMDKYLREI